MAAGIVVRSRFAVCVCGRQTPEGRAGGTQSFPVACAAPVNTVKEVRPVDTPKPLDPSRADVAHIGKSVFIKGELSGSEDLYFDGEVEGSIDLGAHSLTIGPNGRIRANVRAKNVVVNGKVDGDISGCERVELRRSALMVGNIATQRVVVEEGAFFKGQIDIQREAGKEIPKEAPRPVAQSAAASAPAPAGAPQVTLVDSKR